MNAVICVMADTCGNKSINNVMPKNNLVFFARHHEDDHAGVRMPMIANSILDTPIIGRKATIYENVAIMYAIRISAIIVLAFLVMVFLNRYQTERQFAARWNMLA